MRRPSFCCDQHGGGDQHSTCQKQQQKHQQQTQEGGESTLARVRRFLALSMGGTGHSNSRCKHHHHHHHHHAQAQDAIQTPVHSLLANMKTAGVGVQGVLGRPLDEVMAEHGEDSSGQGVPTLVHLLCCFLLTHGVDYDTLVSEDWCAEEVRTRLLVERGAAGVEPDTQDAPPGSDSAVATGLLRLFLDELPHPLLPPDAAPLLLQLANDSGVGETSGEGVGVGGGVAPGLSVAVVPRVRRILHRRLPLHNLCLLRYLAAFIHQLRTGNHNTCPVPVDSLSRVLARVLSPRDGLGQRDEETHRASVNRLGELLILCYNDIFQNQTTTAGGDGGVMQEQDDFSDSVSSPDSAGDSREEEGLDFADDDDDADTTTTDTDDFRSPPVSPLKGVTWGSASGGNKGPQTTTTTSSSSGSPAILLHPPPLTSRSTKEIVSTLDSIRPEAPTYSKEYLSSPVDSLLSPEDNEDEEEFASNQEDETNTQSPESSVISGQDNVESMVESDSRGMMVTGGEIIDHHEERRVSERFFPRSFPPPSRRNKRRLKKRHHIISPQDSGSQSQSAEEEKSSSCFSSLTSDDEPTRYDPIPNDVMPMGLSRAHNSQPSESTGGLSELLNASEPVTSDRGSWGMGDASLCDSWHRTAPRYSRFDDDSSVQNSWYRSSDNDDVMVSPRSSSSSSQAFIDTGAPPGQEERSPPPGQGAVKILMKNINSIKRKIKRYEEEFEAAAGYRPSHSEKMKHKEIKKYMSELSKARKELKQMKDDVAGLVSVPTVFPLSLLRCQESTNPQAKPNPNVSCTADTLRHVEDRLRDKRSAVGRPSELKSMNPREMQEEKTALQKALLYYESLHGRPTTREDRDLARPLYDRYRQVKRIVMRSRTKENLVELPPIIEHVAMDFTLASPQHRSSLQGEEGEKLILAPSNTPVNENLPNIPSEPVNVDPVEQKEGQQRSLAMGDLHALPLSELRERRKEAREEKKKLRRLLREYEEKFEREMGRKVQKEDRGPMEQSYLDYKHAKAKLRLLEALLSKHEANKI